MQVVSGRLDRQTVHYEAPPAPRIEAEMASFLHWFNTAQPDDPLARTSMNERQIKLLNRLLDGFDGKLTSSKWAAIAKCSPDTALRDISDLLERGVLIKAEAGGRSTHYELKPGS